MTGALRRSVAALPPIVGIAAVACALGLALGGAWTGAPRLIAALNEPAWLVMHGDGGRETVVAPLPAGCEAPPGAWSEEVREGGRAGALRDRFGAALADWGQAQWLAGGGRLARVSEVRIDGGDAWLATWWAPDGTASALLARGPGLLAAGPESVVDRGVEAASGDGRLAFELDHLRLHRADTARIGRLAAAFSDPCRGLEGLAGLARGDGPGTPPAAPGAAPDPAAPLPLPDGRPIPIDGGGGWTGLAFPDGAFGVVSPGGRVVVRAPERLLLDGRDLIASWAAEAAHRAEVAAALTARPEAAAEGGFPEELMFGSPWQIVYPATGAERARVVVFTDPDCPHCRRLHEDRAAIQAAGVSMHYAVLPWQALRKGGPDGPAVRAWRAAMRSVWCAEDAAGRLDRLYAGEGLPAADCAPEGEAAEVMDLMLEAPSAVAESMGVRSTPTFVSGAGRVFQGYRDVEGLLERL